MSFQAPRWGGIAEAYGCRRPEAVGGSSAAVGPGRRNERDAVQLSGGYIGGSPPMRTLWVLSLAQEKVPRPPVREPAICRACRHPRRKERSFGSFRAVPKGTLPQANPETHHQWCVIVRLAGMGKGKTKSPPSTSWDERLTFRGTTRIRVSRALKAPITAGRAVPLSGAAPGRTKGRHTRRLSAGDRLSLGVDALPIFPFLAFHTPSFIPQSRGNCKGFGGEKRLKWAVETAIIN